MLAVRTVDTAAVAFGAWFVCAQKKSKFKNKKLSGCLLRVDTASSPRRAPPQQSCSPHGWHSPVPWLGLRRATSVSRTCHAHKNTHTRASCCCCCDAVSLRLVVVLLRLILRSTTTAAYVALSSLVTCNEKPKEKNNANKGKDETRVFVGTNRKESQKRTPVILVLVLVAGKTGNNKK